MPGWEGSDRRLRLPPDWDKIRKRILRRDSYRCKIRNPHGQRCTEPAVDVDHIVNNDDHRESNLQAICDWHHKKKSGAEGAAARTAAIRRTAKKFTRTEAHPGLL
ncbi:HNH endonuclease [Micromonospora sp. GCM10011541]|uniref:HNH endonuclease n=1 Tax=Micromonospora sp. GCM10011541 TaxID=3317336 RepID=UPI003614718A